MAHLCIVVQQQFLHLSSWDNCQFGLIVGIIDPFYWAFVLQLDLSLGFCRQELMSESSSDSTADIVLQNILRHQLRQHREIADLRYELQIVKTQLTEIQITLHVLLRHHGITITKPPAEAERGQSRE